MRKKAKKKTKLSDWIGKEERCELIAFLKRREQYIASGIEDFGDLRNIFEKIFNREPSELFDHEFR